MNVSARIQAVITSPDVDRLDAALEQRSAAIAQSDDGYNPRFLMKYTCGTLLTFGRYCNSRDAKSRAPEVSKWVELKPGSDEWRSEDGRVLVVY